MIYLDCRAVAENHQKNGEHTMSSENNSPARRRLLKAMGAAGGIVAGARTLPPTWTQPVVDGVLLPAHAQTSPGECPVRCSLAISMNFSTDDDDWDLVIALNGNTLSGKGGNVPCLVHAGDRTPPGVQAGDENFREIITNPSGFLAPGAYRVFARLASTETAPANQSLTGSISVCGESDDYAISPNSFFSGDTITIRRFEITAGGSANLLS